MDTIPDLTTSRKNLVAPEIEPGPLDLQPGTLTTRPQRRSISTNSGITTLSFQLLNERLVSRFGRQNN
jgi:hypothetical protein